MANNPLTELRTFGQSIWYDNIRRDLIESGGFKRLIDEDKMRGVTSNPSIFEKAIASSNDYDKQLMQVLSQGKRRAEEIFEELSIQDIQMAADIFKPVYDESDEEDGYISLEVSPLLSDQEEETVQAALDIFTRVDRPNIMIKVPATEAGIRAHERLIGMGIPINMTLIFSLECYEAVAKAYINGLKLLNDTGQPMGKVRSVASVFVSRIDTAVDPLILAKGDELKALAGKIAIANSKMIYQKFLTLFQTPDFLALKKLGAHVQRPLWGSTGTKNPNYSDVLYIEELIGPHTVNTAPPATIDAFRDHGKLRFSIEEDVPEAEAVLSKLKAGGIDLNTITKELQEAGVKAFADSYQNLLTAITQKKERLLDQHRMHYS
ncbi:MAG: transaldolase [Nitrospirae bacterium]|nr:transaldolase [Candidatus Manganitrophaceae bacterium]